MGLEIVSSIQPKVLDFLRKKSEGFGKMLDLANTNYIGDDHALLVLNSLGIVQKFLLPFTSGPFENIEKIGKIVMDQCRGIDAVSDVPVSRYLATVTAQLDVIECSYFAFDEISVSSEKILNFIRNLFPNGKYISSLRNSEKGASLAFEYSSLIEDKKASLKFVLSADDLRELVQVYFFFPFFQRGLSHLFFFAHLVGCVTPRFKRRCWKSRKDWPLHPIL